MEQTNYGSKTLIAVRRLADEANVEGQALSYETTHELDLSRDSSDTSTKSGKVYSYDEVSGDFTTELVSSGDTTVKLLKNALLNNDELEFWRISLDKPAEGEEDVYEMEYFQGRLKDYDVTADSDDFVQISVEANVQPPVEGTGKFVPATTGGGYEFRDLSKVTTGSGDNGGSGSDDGSGQAKSKKA